MKDPKPWERQTGESLKAYNAFTIYRDMPIGERSLSAVGRQLNCTPPNVARWSTQWKWIDRLQAWYGELDRRKRSKQIQQTEQMAVRHANQARLLSHTLMLPARELSRRIREEPEKINEFLRSLPNTALIDLINKIAPAWALTMKAERLSRGEATDTLQLLEQAAKRLHSMSDDELRAIAGEYHIEGEAVN